MSSVNEPYKVFAILPDPSDKQVYTAMWRNYLGEVKSWSCVATDELDAYVKATAFIADWRAKRRSRMK